jgi:hypothetical protein
VDGGKEREKARKRVVFHCYCRHEPVYFSAATTASTSRNLVEDGGV